MKVLSFGEVLWDLIEGEQFIGGAPFNLAAHLAQCGDDVAIMTRLGRDDRGQAALAEISRRNVRTDLVQRDEHRPTGWAQVELDRAGRPTFTFPEQPAYDFIELDETARNWLASWTPDLICFGTLVQRGPTARAALYELLDMVTARHVFYDVNIRLDYYPTAVLVESLNRSTIVKLNGDEAVQLCGRIYDHEHTEREFAERLCGDFHLELVCVTKEASGCTVYTAGGQCDHAAPRIKVADTVGAGDAFSAGFLHRYCQGASLERAAGLANTLGAFVASHTGAVPEYDAALRRQLSE